MPDDEALSEDLIRRYEEVRQHFVSSPDERCIPLFLGSFGGGDGFGVYQLVEDVLAQHPPERVVSHLLSALTSGNRNTSYWAAEIAANFPAEDLVPPLRSLLEKDDEDLVTAAAIALGQIKTREATAALQLALERASSDHIRHLISDQLR
jgi:hypothetical protein